MDRFNLLQVAYWTCLASTCLIALRRGQRPEWQGSAIMVAGSIATVVAASFRNLNVGAIHVGVLSVDVAVFAAFLFIALRSDRFWPLWVCGFHLVGITTHLVMLQYPEIVPRAYKLVRGLWAYPMMGAIVMASLRGWRSRRRSGAA